MADWIFAKRDGGQDQGPHDAGVEAFMGDLEWYIAREAIQNSLDARLNKKQPVEVEFQLDEYDRSKIPGIETLSSTFTQCGDYWKHDKDATTLFTTASEVARRDSIKVLRISDSNTTGVKGNDADKLGGWYNLTRCIGASSKGAGAGGSYGLGKHAPFAASQLRTILYSTMTEDNKRSFIGEYLSLSRHLTGEKRIKMTSSIKFTAIILLLTAFVTWKHNAHSNTIFADENKDINLIEYELHGNLQDTRSPVETSQIKLAPVFNTFFYNDRQAFNVQRIYLDFPCKFSELDLEKDRILCWVRSRSGQVTNIFGIIFKESRCYIPYVFLGRWVPS